MDKDKAQALLMRNDFLRQRLFSRLKRTINALDKLERQRKRIKIALAAMAEDQGVPLPKPDYTPGRLLKPEDEPEYGRPPKDDGLDIPPMLNRLNALPDPRTKEKKTERKVVERQKTERELTGKTRKMPLTGKAALAALK